MKKVTDFIKRLVVEYGYKPLPADKSILAQEWFKEHLPELYNDEPLYTLSGELLATCYERVVVGDYGAYIEINHEHMMLDFKIKKGQEYRHKDSFRGKYLWYTSEQDDCKIYYQLRKVYYADYKPGKYYISPYEVQQYINEGQTTHTA